MPILSYQCEKCGFKFEELVKRHDEGTMSEMRGRNAARLVRRDVFCNGEAAQEMQRKMLGMLRLPLKRSRGELQ